MTAETCAACGSSALTEHLRVAGDAGHEGLVPTTTQFGVALGDIVRCSACGHMQVSPMPATEELDRAYEVAESEDYVEEEVGQRVTARGALERIEAALGRRGRILDLGCWTGFLLAEAQSRGWEALGIEPSTFASAWARDHLGLDVRTEDLFTADLPPGTFDAVVLGDVIEHLPDPGAALARIAGLMRSDGVLYMTLPDAGSRLARRLGARWWSVIPTHVQYFTRGSMTTLLRRNGWTPLEFVTAPKAFTVRYYLERIGGYAPPVARGLVGVARATGVAERVWAPDFRDRMAVVARAPSPAPDGLQSPSPSPSDD